MIACKTLVPDQDFVLVKADEVEVKTQSEGGLHLPDDAQAVQVKRTGEVVAKGPEVPAHRPFAVGDRILFSAYAGTEVEVDGVVYELMKASSVLAVIT